MQSWQSEYKKLLQETDEWFTRRQEKRKKDLEKGDKRVEVFVRIMKPISSWFFLPIGMLMVLFLYVNNTLYVYMGEQDFSTFTHMADPRSFVLSMRGMILALTLAFIGYGLFTIAKTFFEVTAKTPVFSLPSGYVLCWVVAILAMFLAVGGIGDEIAVMAQWGIAVIFLVFLVVNDNDRRSQKEVDVYVKQFMGRLEGLKDLPDDGTEIEESKEQKCSLCEKEGIYEVCLACEQRFRGERHRVRSQILRAKQHSVPATLTLKEWLDLLATFHWRCAYCAGPYEVMEHYIPVTQGGGTTADNCVPACISCNSKKAGKHPEQEVRFTPPPKSRTQSTKNSKPPKGRS